MSSNNHYDVIVIGAGIAGIGCAAMLDSDLSVLVLEGEEQIGYHATGRSAAIFIPGYGGPEIRELTRLSEHYLGTAPDAPDIDSFLHKRGELILASKAEEDILTGLLSDAPSLQEITVSQALELVPILQTGSLHRIAFDSSARDIDVDLLLQSFRKMLSQQNRKVLTNHAVTALDFHADKWQLTTSDATFQAPVVVNAAGAWADRVATLAGVPRQKLTPCRRSAALIAAPGDYSVEDWPAFASASESWYAKPMSGKLMVSPADEDPVEPHDAYPQDLTLAQGIDRYEQAVTLPVKHVEHQWAGLRTFAPDRVPVAGYDPQAKGFFWLAGHGGYGIQTSPALSKLAASLVSGHTPDTELQPLVEALSPARARC